MMNNWFRLHGRVPFVSLISLVLLIGVVALAWIPRNVPSGPMQALNVRCGPESLRIAGLRLGVPLSFESISTIPLDPITGASIGELKKSAAGFGIFAESRRITFDQLAAHTGTAILLIRGNHFVTVDPREKPSKTESGQVVRVYDSGKLAAWWTRSELEGVWNGETVLCSRSQSGQISGPGLRWDSCLTDLGMIEEPEIAEFIFPMSNRGTTPLEVSIEGTSCNCASATLSSEELQPGESGVLRATVNVRSKAGHFVETVRVRSNDPSVSLTEVVLCGSSLNKIVSARSVHLGTILPDQRSVRHIIIRDSGDGRLIVNSAEWSSQVSEFRLPSIEAQCRIMRVESEVEWRKILPLGTQFSEGDYVVEVAVRPTTESVEGKFSGLLDISTNLPGNWAKFSVVVEGLVGTSIQAVPAALKLSSEANGGIVELKHHLGTRLMIEEAVVEGELPLEIEVLQRSGNPVSIRIRCSSNLGRSKTGSIVCRFSSHRTIRIPVIYTHSESSP